MTHMPTLRERMRYRFDNSMSRGAIALIGYLAAASAALILVFTVLVLLASLGPTRDLTRALYDELLHVVNAGQIQADDPGDASFVAVQFVLTLGGIVIFSALVGVLTTSLDSRLQELRKGRSRVLERDHTLVLGWSDAVFTVLSELAVANEGRRDASVVILAERDKVEMEDAIRTKVSDLLGTRVICRTGSPIDMAELAIANPNAARSIIVLSPEGAESDSEVINTLLAVLKSPDRRREPIHVVAEIRNAANLQAARIVGGSEASLINKGETVARLIVQTSRQPGAAAVYQELLGFEGDEIYFRGDPQLTGRPFQDALFAYEDCCVLGVRRADGVSELNPPMGYVLAAEDEIVALAEDQAALEAAAPAAIDVDAAAIVHGALPPAEPQHALILNYNERTPEVVAELDNYVEPGSTVSLIAENLDVDQLGKRIAGGLRNLKVRTSRAQPTDREALEAIDYSKFAQAIVMSPGGESDPRKADARTLITLLHLRDLATARGHRFTIASEMLDTRNRQLAQVTQVDDVIVSDQLISLMLSQISENVALGQVFYDLFRAEGSEVYLRPAEAYVRPGATATFATFIAAATARSETAFGYRHAARAGDAAAAYGVVVNPAKSARFTVAPGDKLIVLAED